jgi:AcrR family transcriptional regulator
MVQRETIIEQSAKLFAEQGIKSIRMDDIAQSLGVSKRTLYEMVEDKEELLYLSIRYMQSRRMAKVEQKLRENTESLVQLFDSFALMTENRELHRRISSNLRKFYPATFERLRKEAEAESGKILFSLIQHYIDCGLIVPTVDIRLSVTILHYTTTTIVTSADNMTLPDGVTVNDALAYTIINFFRGIATIKGVQQIDDYLESKRKNSNNI